jgi:hypothetical protein
VGFIDLSSLLWRGFFMKYFYIKDRKMTTPIKYPVFTETIPPTQSTIKQETRWRNLIKNRNKKWSNRMKKMEQENTYCLKRMSNEIYQTMKVEGEYLGSFGENGCRSMCFHYYDKIVEINMKVMDYEEI